MKKNLFALLIISLAFQSCLTSDDDGDGQTFCTLEFRIIGLNVIGDTLTDFYTIRSSNNDTIRLQKEPVYDNFYPVLNDNYQTILKNKQEEFIFIGLKSDSIRVNQRYVLEADECHISKVSGVTEVRL